MSLTQDQLNLLAEWSSAKTLAALQYQIESTLRDRIVKEFFTGKESGSETIEVINGWKLEATNKLDYKLDNNEGQVLAVDALIDRELSAKLIKWKPELSISTYKQLDAATQGLFNGCLTIKPAKPMLKLIPPKTEEIK
jgi:hypothetical protein